VPGKLRIIGGSWRSRKLDVADIPGLRPTPDRVRETLFNWLQPHLPNAHCLDLYAGTGILGFEALSRGAASVVMVEKNKLLAEHLQQQAVNLKAKEFKIMCMDVSDWFNTCDDLFDIIFLDPPYKSKQAGNNIQQLLNFGCLQQGACIYVESDHEIEDVDPRLQMIKSSKAGAVQYRLFRYI
jgi:16S rRNA (guanine966-N2)-methyltransferase